MERSRNFDNEKLIKEVSKRPSLWNQKSIDYLSRTLKVRDWENVSVELNSTVNIVKNRWKLLKDSFNREVRNMTKNNNNNKSRSKWAHFDQMSFLLKGSNSLLLPNACLSHSLTEVDSQMTTSSSCENDLSENSLANQEDEDIKPVLCPRKKLRCDPPQVEILTSPPLQTNQSVEFYEPTATRQEHGNEDYYFLMSLLPTFERMPPRQKMIAKIKMMQDVYESAFCDSTSDPNFSTPDSEDICLNTVSSGS